MNAMCKCVRRETYAGEFENFGRRSSRVRADSPAREIIREAAREVRSLFLLLPRGLFCFCLSAPHGVKEVYPQVNRVCLM
jgi:hypothetical protein